MVKLFVNGNLQLNDSFSGFEKIPIQLERLDDPKVIRYALEHHCELKQASWEIKLQYILKHLDDNYCIVTEPITYLSDDLPNFDSTKITKLTKQSHCYYIPKTAQFEISVSEVDYTVEEEIVAGYI